MAHRTERPAGETKRPEKGMSLRESSTASIRSCSATSCGDLRASGMDAPSGRSACEAAQVAYGSWWLEVQTALRPCALLLAGPYARHCVWLLRTFAVPLQAEVHAFPDAPARWCFRRLRGGSTAFPPSPGLGGFEAGVVRAAAAVSKCDRRSMAEVCFGNGCGVLGKYENGKILEQ